jgi:hypothetical protein
MRREENSQVNASIQGSDHLGDLRDMDGRSERVDPATYRSLPIPVPIEARSLRGSVPAYIPDLPKAGSAALPPSRGAGTPSLAIH